MAEYIAAGYWTPDDYVGTVSGVPSEDGALTISGTVSAGTTTSVASTSTIGVANTITPTTTVTVVRADGSSETRTVQSVSGSTIFVDVPFSIAPQSGDTFFLLQYSYSAVFSALQSASPSAVIELFELQLNTALHGVAEIYRFHAGSSLNANGELIWNGSNYLRFPVEADGFEYSGNGQLPRPKMRVSNILGTITAILLTLPDGMEGAKLTRIRTLARYIDAANFPGGVNPYGTPDPTAEFPREIYYVDRKTAETRDVVEFELAAAFDLAGVRAPKRQCIANMCQWVYKSTECSYAGGLPTCTKTLDDCKTHFGATAELPFGSFPGIGTYFS